VIATGFEGGGAYRPERPLNSFVAGDSGEGDLPGAAIPSFPESPARRVARIAGLPRPENCL